eukprot:m.70426 g.70426  ORF g.70426 m.70426 type:complete len:454 (+) comp35695_c0_seq3:42-1403(+)
MSGYWPRRCPPPPPWHADRLHHVPRAAPSLGYRPWPPPPRPLPPSLPQGPFPLHCHSHQLPTPRLQHARPRIDPFLYRPSHHQPEMNQWPPPPPPPPPQPHPYLPFQVEEMPPPPPLLPTPPSLPPPPPPPHRLPQVPVPPRPKPETVTVEQIFDPPGRQHRPRKFVVLLRGPPGTGKSHLAKLLKDKEVKYGCPAPRIISLDDYFLSEVDGKKNEMEYCYEAEMEEVYYASLLKAFRKTLEKQIFTVIIVDAVNEKVSQIESLGREAQSQGFEIFVAQLMSDAAECANYSTHRRNLEDIARIIDGWEETPFYFKCLDVRSLMQDVVINEVVMDASESLPPAAPLQPSSGSMPVFKAQPTSRWESATDEKLDTLDGLKRGKKRKREEDEDLISLISMAEEDSSKGDGKRVKWADVEEKKGEKKRKEIGFVIGQDWSQYTMDEHTAEKYLENAP